MPIANKRPGQVTTTSPTIMEHELKIRDMIQARINGANWADIAQDFGYSGSNSARVAVVNWVERQNDKSAVEAKEIIGGRYEALFNAYWRDAIGDPENGIQPDLKKAYFIRDILRDMAKLHGLYNPSIHLENNETNQTVNIYLPGKDPISLGRGEDIVDGELSD